MTLTNPTRTSPIRTLGDAPFKSLRQLLDEREAAIGLLREIDALDTNGCTGREFGLTDWDDLRTGAFDRVMERVRAVLALAKADAR